MILSRGRGYLFVHIPKTGGTAMALALEARAMADDILVGDTPKAKSRRGRLNSVTTAGRLWKHSTLAEAEGLFTREELDDLFVFTLVRNPWDRLVSYYHWLREQSFDHPSVGLSKTYDFRGFLSHPTTIAAIAGSPYDSYMRDGAGRDRADMYVRLEAAEDHAALAERLELKLEMPVANVSRRERDWRVYYDARSADLVADICRSDIRRFGYAFDPAAG